jgi:hypothetical protein
MLEWQKNYKSHVETLSDNFEAACHSVDSIQSAFSDIQDRAEKIVSTPAELNDVLEKIDLRLDELNTYLKDLASKEANFSNLDSFNNLKPKDESDTQQSSQTNTTVVAEPANFWGVLGGILAVMYLSYLIVGKVISWLFG